MAFLLRSGQSFEFHPKKVSRTLTKLDRVYQYVENKALNQAYKPPRKYQDKLHTKKLQTTLETLPCPLADLITAGDA